MRILVFCLCLLACGVSHAANTQKNPCGNVPHSIVEEDAAGDTKGCRLSQVDSGSLYERLGLKVGDLVQAASEGTASSKMELLNDLRESESSMNDAAD